MAKYKFYAATGSRSSIQEDIVELPDDYTEKDVQAEYDAWCDNNVEFDWHKIEE